MDGFAAVAEMRRRPELSDTMFIAVSASALDRSRERSLAAGFHGYISKTVGVETLPETIVDLLAPGFEWQAGHRRGGDGEEALQARYSPPSAGTPFPFAILLNRAFSDIGRPTAPPTKNIITAGILIDDYSLRIISPGHLSELSRYSSAAPTGSCRERLSSQRRISPAGEDLREPEIR